MPPRFKFELKFATTNPEGVRTMWVEYGEDDVSIEDIRLLQASIIEMAEARRQEAEVNNSGKDTTE